MIIMQSNEPPTGDYVRILYEDTEQMRTDGRELMRRQGCKGVRFETLDNGALQVHGYLRFNNFAEQL